MNGLSATTVLALHGLHLMLRRRKPVRPGDIARSGAFPAAQVRDVLAKLLGAGLIQRRSSRGYVLAKAPGEIRLLDVLRAVEGPKTPEAPCDGDYDACDSRASCILAPLCRKAEEAFRESMKNFTLAEFEDVAVDLPNCLDPNLRNRAS